jgi:hypothetical protein
MKQTTYTIKATEAQRDEILKALIERKERLEKQAWSAEAVYRLVRDAEAGDDRTGGDG